jgi:hypothetical protein
MKTCSIENCNNPIWSKGVCKNHMIKKSFTSKVVTKKGVSDGKSLQKSSLLQQKLDKSPSKFLEMRQFFLSIWDKKPHRSEISGVYLGKEAMSTYFHHILPKEKYPEACLDEENIVILSLEEHSNIENDMYKYEEINDRRKHLLKKYERS